MRTRPSPTSRWPFCVHDCYHTHWRWAQPPLLDAYKREWMGWSLDGEPYRVPGAPMVAANQTVVLTVAGTGFHYQADIDRPAPGEWQIVMHHGSSYAVAENMAIVMNAPRVRSLIIKQLSLLAGIEEAGPAAMTGGYSVVTGGSTWVPPNSTDWPLFYWHLRYEIRTPKHVMFQGVTPGSFSERNRVAADRALEAKMAAG